MTDWALRRDVIDALEFEPSISAAEIGAAVEDGVVTLSDHVTTYAERKTAVDVTLGIKGVTAIADEIEVRSDGEHSMADDEIAGRIGRMLKWNTAVPERRLHATVHNGHVTLSGTVEWRY